MLTAVQTFHRLRVGITNCFLLRCQGGYLLVDAGYTGMYRTLVRGLNKRNIDVSQIKYLLITHHHHDHAGCASELIANTGVRVIVHRKALDFLARGQIERTSRSVNSVVNFLVKLSYLFYKRAYPSIRLGQDDYVVQGDDSDVLKRIGVDGIVLHTPGHTEDSISVILSDGTAFVGDAASNFSTTFWRVYWPVLVQDVDEVYHSWEKLVENGAEMLYPSHGKPFAIARLISYKQKRDKSLSRSVTQGRTMR